MSKTLHINLHVEPAQHCLLTKAATLLHMDRSTFILDVACREAENILLDQRLFKRLFKLSQENFIAFETASFAPIPENEKLKSLLHAPSPWEK